MKNLLKNKSLNYMIEKSFNYYIIQLKRLTIKMRMIKITVILILLSLIELIIFMNIFISKTLCNYNALNYNYDILLIVKNEVKLGGIYLYLQEVSNKWWENGWVWTAIATIAGIIIGIIRLILNYLNNKKPDKGYRKRN